MDLWTCGLGVKMKCRHTALFVFLSLTLVNLWSCKDIKNGKKGAGAEASMGGLAIGDLTQEGGVLSIDDGLIAERFCRYLNLSKTAHDNNSNVKKSDGNYTSYRSALYDFELNYRSCLSDNDIEESFGMNISKEGLSNLKYTKVEGVSNRAIYDVMDASDSNIANLCASVSDYDGSFYLDNFRPSAFSGKTYFYDFAKDADCGIGDGGHYLCVNVSLGAKEDDSNYYRIIETLQVVVHSTDQRILTTYSCIDPISGNPMSGPACVAIRGFTTTIEATDIAPGLEMRGIPVRINRERACSANDDNEVETTLMDVLGIY
ncbi:MAG: hypothetical protein KBD63_00135 [Bacteriovoracaceae bacterium]|nr:hypothetical protein [Bacteriovoracaceae bacterium]